MESSIRQEKKMKKTPNFYSRGMDLWNKFLIYLRKVNNRRVQKSNILTKLC